MAVREKMSQPETGWDIFLGIVNAFRYIGRI